MIRTAFRLLLGVFYAFAGLMHLVRPAPFVSIVPGGILFPEEIVFWTGIAELAGAAGLLQPFDGKIRRLAGIGLAAYALCVWPANINHFAMDMAQPDNGLGLAYHVPRMVAQPMIIWLALWVGGATDWPFHRRPRNLS